jgi:hypothetical protein
MNGVVQGGWEFVIAAYTITGGAFLIYMVTLIKHYRDESARAAADGEIK